MFFFRESDAGWMNKDGRRVSCEVMWMFPVAVRRVEPASLMETHYSSVCLTDCRETDRSQTDGGKILFPVLPVPPSERKPPLPPALQESDSPSNWD